MSNFEREIGRQINDSYEKNLREKGLSESDTKKIMSRLREVDEEQRYNALNFFDEYDVASKRGFTLE